MKSRKTFLKGHSSIIRFLGFSLIALCVASCSSSDQSAAAPSYLNGYVSARQEVSGSQIEVTDVSGTVLAEKKAPATSDTGVFMITVQDLPNRFRVVSSGGTNPSGTINYRLSGQFEGFNPDQDIIYINLATTLVCAYIDRNPGATLADATNAVKTFLGIPAEIDIRRGLYHDENYFSPAAFLKEAATTGGVDVFMGTLVDEMIQGSPATHTFPQQPLLMDTGLGEALTESAGTSMAVAARNGVIAWGAGFALNKGMEALFPGTGAPTKADITELKNMLIDMKAQLTQLENSVASAKDELVSEIRQDIYNIGSMQMADYVLLVNNTFDDLNKELQKDPATLTDAEKVSRIKTINVKIDTIGVHIEPYLGALHNKLYGNGTLGAQGLYKMYADMIKTQKRFFTKANYQDKVKNLFLYYNQIEANELWLAVEYYHARDLSKTIVDTHTNKLGTDSQAELDWFNSAKPIPLNTYIYQSSKFRLMIYMPDNFTEIFTFPMYVIRGPGNDVFYVNVVMNTWKRLGFTNWALPSIAQVNDMFSGWSGNSPGDFAKAQGLNPFPMGAAVFIPLSQPDVYGSSLREMDYWITNHADDSHSGFYYYRTSDGEYCWLQWQAPNNLNFVPVREIQSTEKYIW